MRSTMNNSNDEDDFAPNPFRSNTSDFLDVPAPAAPMPPQQQQQPMYSQSHIQMQQQQQQQMQQQMQPDPNSGMTGFLNYPPPQQPEQYPQQQTPHPSTFLSGQMDKMGVPAANPSSNPQNQQVSSAFSWIMGCFRVDQATQLFDVDADDIASRLRASLTDFYKPNHFRLAVVGDANIQQAANNGTVDPSQAASIPVADLKGPGACLRVIPLTIYSLISTVLLADLYGPFWISMTLIFALGVASNLSDYLHHARKADADDVFKYDITHVLHALYIVISFSFGVPSFFWLACSCLGLPVIDWPMWICCYGYSMTPILVGCFVAWWLPFHIWHWLILVACVGASGLLVVRNLSTPLLSHEQSSAMAAPVLMSILGTHGIYLFVLKLTFFR